MPKKGETGTVPRTFERSCDLAIVQPCNRAVLSKSCRTLLILCLPRGILDIHRSLMHDTLAPNPRMQLTASVKPQTTHHWFL